MTHRPTRPAPRDGVDPAVRAARAAAVTLLALPAMLLAHLVTTRTVPQGGVIVLVALAVFLVTAGTGTRSRWRLSLVVGLAQVAGHALLAALHPAIAGSGAAGSGGCLPMVGRGAELGLRFALLRHDAACPQGTVSAGPTATAALAGLLAALLILSAHSLVAVLAAALAITTQLAVDALRAWAALVSSHPTPVRVPVGAPRKLIAEAGARRPVRPRWTPRPALRRGPPAALPVG